MSMTSAARSWECQKKTVTETTKHWEADLQIKPSLTGRQWGNLHLTVERIKNPKHPNAVVTLLVGCLRLSNMLVYLRDRSAQTTEVAVQTFHLTQSQYTNTRPTSPSTDPITSGAWQGSHWSANFLLTVWLNPEKSPQVETEPLICCSGGVHLNH